MKKRFYPTLCLTHNCNLNCVYCYQKHDTLEMSLETAKKCVDWIFENAPDETDEIEIGAIGGEPLLKFDLLKELFEYCESEKKEKDFVFFASTNGTVLTEDMKKWFSARKDKFILGLSLDGTPDTHNHNRSNSFEKIDIDFFNKTWPKQGVKMTLTDYSINHLAENIKYIHSLGIENICGANLYEGTFDWEKESFVEHMIPQLEELVNYYVENDELTICQLLNKKIGVLENKIKTKKKYCGIGTGVVFFDVDGSRRPCGFCTPMTFNEDKLKIIENSDFTKEEDFVDDECFETCYIQSLCPNCAGSNFLNNNSFKKRDKSKCRIQKLITLYTADLALKRMLKNPHRYSDAEKVLTLRAAKKIKSLFLPEFEHYMHK